MKLKSLIYLTGVFLLLACGNKKHTTSPASEETNTEQPGEPTTMNNEMQIWVNSYLDHCDKSDETYYLLTQSGETIDEGLWQCTYKTISGFNFEPGYIYQLKVKTVMSQGLPQLELISEMSKKRDPAYFKLHDIWAVTHMNGEVIELNEYRPRMEINLTAMKVFGNASCNDYSGEIIQYSTSKIAFGPLPTTKKMCPEIGQERIFMNALRSTKSYQLKGTSLLFYDESGNELIQFQKVD